MRYRLYSGSSGRTSIGLRFSKQPFLDGYENPFPNRNYDPRPLSVRVAENIEKLENQGKKARTQSYILIPQIKWSGRRQEPPYTTIKPPIIRPDRTIWDKIGNRTFYRLYGLNYFSGCKGDAATSGLQTAIQASHSKVFVKDAHRDAGYPIASTANYWPSTTLNKWYMGIDLEGETASGQLSTSRGDVVGAGAGTRGAFFVWTGSNGGTILQTSPQNKYPGGQGVGGQTSVAGFAFGQHVENLGFDSGGNATDLGPIAGIGLDLTSQETGLKTLVRNVWAGRYTTDATGKGHFFSTVAVVLDGSEDSTVDQLFTGGSSVAGNVIDISWYTGVGNVGIINSEMAGQTSAFIMGQTVYIMKTTLTNIKIIATALLQPSLYCFQNCYIANDQMPSGAGILDLNGKIANTVKFISSAIKPSTGCFMIKGAGTITNLSFDGVWFNNARSTTWTTGSPTITRQQSVNASPPTTGATNPGTNYESSGSLPTGCPFTRDANGNW